MDFFIFNEFKNLIIGPFSIKTFVWLDLYFISIILLLLYEGYCVSVLK